MRNPEKVPKAIEGAKLVVGDVTDIKSLRKAMSGVGIVYHCAGISRIFFV